MAPLQIYPSSSPGRRFGQVAALLPPRVLPLLRETAAPVRIYHPSPHGYRFGRVAALLSPRILPLQRAVVASIQIYPPSPPRRRFGSPRSKSNHPPPLLGFDIQTNLPSKAAMRIEADEIR